MGRTTVKQTFQIGAKTIKKYTEIMLLALVIQIVVLIISCFFRTSVLEDEIQTFLFQLIQDVFLTFLVQIPVYLGVYSYLTEQEFTRETIFVILRERAVRLLLVILFQAVSSFVFGQFLPELIERWGRYGPLPPYRTVEFGLQLSTILLRLANFTIYVWTTYLTMTILISEPRERGLIQKATYILFRFFGTRLRVTIAAQLLILTLFSFFGALVALFLGEVGLYIGAGLGSFFVFLTDMAIFIKLLPGEERIGLEKRAL